jgi:methyltransferase (TIGR00027 family)
MAKEAAKTAAKPTTIVAIEQYFPKNQRLIEDSLACEILPFDARAFVALMRFRAARDWMVRRAENFIPGVWSGMICRKRCIDDLLTQAASQKEVDAVVNLGAGFDTRAYRLPALADVPVWEVDQPEIIHAKQTRLSSVFGAVPPQGCSVL